MRPEANEGMNEMFNERYSWEINAMVFEQIYMRQESIPVGCVPPAFFSGVSLQRPPRHRPPGRKMGPGAKTARRNMGPGRQTGSDIIQRPPPHGQNY